MTIFDIHSHLLPKIDDGKMLFTNFASMMEEYKKNGFDSIVFTPHLNDPFVKTKILEIHERFERCKEIALEHGIEAYLGSEFYVTGNDDNLLAIPMFDKYVLCEFDPFIFNVNVTKKIDELFNLGYVVILAHVERYEWLSFESPIFKEFLEKGCLVQVNAATCETEKAKAYLENGVVDFIAGDNHGNFEYPHLLKEKLDQHPEILNKMSKFALNLRR